MSRFLRSRKSQKGLPPGSFLARVGPQSEQMQIHLTCYNKNDLLEISTKSLQDHLSSIRDQAMVTWIHIQGSLDKELIENIRKLFGVHELWLEDVLNTDHRPKIEELDNLIFAIVKTIHYPKADYQLLEFQQVSLFLGDGFVLSFQEGNRDIFSTILKRIRQSIGRIRDLKSDYLFYSLLDCIIDQYYEVVELIGEEIETLDEKVEEDFDEDDYYEIMRLKTEVMFLKKTIRPLTDILHSCLNLFNPILDRQNRRYFKDAYDHVLHISEIVENYREIVLNARETYRTMQANQMNDIMKTLTLFASLFIPLTFIAGIYGMNFEHMPELKWGHGYFYSLGLMGTVALFLLGYFKYKKWF